MLCQSCTATTYISIPWVDSAKRGGRGGGLETFDSFYTAGGARWNGVLHNCQLIVVPLDAAIIGFSFNQHQLLYREKENVGDLDAPFKHLLELLRRLQHTSRGRRRRERKTLEGASNSFPPLHVLMDSELTSQHTPYSINPTQPPLSPVPQFARSSPKGYNHKLLLSVTAYLLDR